MQRYASLDVYALLCASENVFGAQRRSIMRCQISVVASAIVAATTATRYLLFKHRVDGVASCGCAVR